MKESTKAARRQFSRVGAVLFIFLVLTLVLQTLCAAVVARLYPEFAQNPWLYFSVNYLPYYLLAVPYTFLLMRLNTVGVPPKQKMGFWELMSFLPICVAMSYVGNMVGNVLNTVISVFQGKMPENALEGLLQNSNVVVTFVFVVLLAPIFEELVFRKLLIDAVYPYGEKVCIALSALLFGAFHGNFYQFFYAALVGALLGFVYCRTGKVLYTIILHASFNFLGGLVSGEVISLLDAAALAEGDLLSLLTENPIGTLLYLGYSMLMFGLSVLGVILLIIKKRKTRLLAGAVQLRRPILTAVTSLGMILFLAVCGLLFIVSM